MRGDDLIAGQIGVAQLNLDAIAQRWKHVGEQQHFLPLRVVTLDRRRLTLRHSHINMVRYTDTSHEHNEYALSDVYVCDKTKTKPKPKQFWAHYLCP